MRRAMTHLGASTRALRALLARGLGGLLLVALCTVAAFAEEIKPRVLLVFDTSGSMSFDLVTGRNTGGDNSEAYPGNGGLSRLSVAKQVITEIITTASEVAFALMRYPQVEGAGINDGVGREPFTMYQGLQEKPLNYKGTCTGQLRRERAETSFSLLEPFAPNNENAILRWLDGQEAWPIDRELRAEGPTPIAESLRLAESYLRTEVMPNDPALDCRQTYVILFTDGAESCVTSDPQQALLSRTLALRQMNVLRGGATVRKDVRVFVVAFAVEPAQMGLLDVIARAGGTAVNAQGELDLIGGRAYQANDLAGLRRAFARIIAEAIPVEICDGIDNDCDGRIDEGVLNACGECGPTPEEICDGIDNDCDGFIDEGVTNACGGCGPVPEEICDGIDNDCDGLIDEGVENTCGGCANVQMEICDGLDNDCDGLIDNIPGTDQPLQRPCGTDVGACRSGVQLCQNGVWGACSGVMPSEEICDGIDNDCDGFVDEATRPCGPALEIGNVGQCRVGVQRCDFKACQENPSLCDEAGWAKVCEGAMGPSEEVCDGLDNNCDGQIDEGLLNACGFCGPAPPEICNGVDDNCDGRVDEEARCPRGYLCWMGECVTPCDNSGECPSGQYCTLAWGQTRLCHSDPCVGAQCAPGLVCDRASARCVDPCAGAECAAGTVCDLGACVPASCRTEGCPEGERCRGDVCEADPCAEVECDGRSFCRDGACVPACVGVRCGEGQVCFDGECVADACGGRCLSGQYCDAQDGACVADLCQDVDCPQGTACELGECLAQSPCAVIDCPQGTHCVRGTCTDGQPGVEPNPFANPPTTPQERLDRGVPVPTEDAGAPPADAQGPAPTIDQGVLKVDAQTSLTTPEEEGGCQCDLSGAEGGPGGGVWLLLAGLALGRRRLERASPRRGA